MTRRIVYVSYDGIRDPLGASQVLPYIRGLTRRGHHYELLSFEKAPARPAFREPLAPGIRWTGLRYHKTPTLPATAFDMLQGSIAGSLLAAVADADIVHARSTVAAAIALPACTLLKKPLLYDMRGLWVDERIESGAWNEQGVIPAAARRVEGALFRRCSAITVLTNRMADHLRERDEQSEIRAPIHVIPTCVDLDHFHPEVPRDPEIERRVRGFKTLVYLGSLGPRYRVEDMARFYLAWRSVAAPARFLVVSQQDPKPLLDVLRPHQAEGELVHVSLPRERVPAAAACADAGVFLYTPGIATAGVAPTKLGELLACGIPVAGDDVGDVPSILKPDVGTQVLDTTPDGLRAAADRLAALAVDPATGPRCRRAATTWFGLDDGVAAYDSLYQRLVPGTLTSDAGWPRPSTSDRRSTRGLHHE